LQELAKPAVDFLLYFVKHWFMVAYNKRRGKLNINFKFLAIPEEVYKI